MGSASTHGIARKAPLPLPFVPSPPIAPEGLSADLTAMVQRMIAAGPASDAEALRALRAAFPDAPLTLRVAALDTMMRRHAG
jgi:hypothetical protein